MHIDCGWTVANDDPEAYTFVVHGDYGDRDVVLHVLVPVRVIDDRRRNRGAEYKQIDDDGEPEKG